MTEQQFAQRAEALLDLGRTEDAMTLLKQGLLEHSEGWGLWTLLAWARYKLAELDEAERAAEHALGLNPRSELAMLVIAYIAIDRGDCDRAHEFTDRLLRVDQSDPAAHLAKARAYAAEPDGETRHREIIWQGANYAASLAPEDADVLLRASDMLQRIGCTPEAVALVRRGLEVSPNHSGLQMQLTSLQANNGTQQMRGWARVLATDPMHVSAAVSVNSAVWQRTRFISTVAIWGVPALVVPPVAFVLIVQAVRNAWTLFVEIPRGLPKGALSRIWGSRRAGWFAVCCSVIGATWPLQIPVVVISGQAWLLVLSPLLLLIGDTISTLAVASVERDWFAKVPVFGRGAVIDACQQNTLRGIWRILVGIVIAVLTSVAFFTQPEPSATAGALAAAGIALSAAFIVAPTLYIRHAGRMKRELS